MDTYYKNDAIQKTNKMKSHLYDYIRRGLYDFKEYKRKENIIELKDSKDLREIQKLYEDLDKNYETLNDNYEHLKKYCLNEDKI